MSTLEIALVVTSTITVELLVALVVLILTYRIKNGEFHEDVVGGAIAAVFIVAICAGF